MAELRKIIHVYSNGHTEQFSVDINISQSGTSPEFKEMLTETPEEVLARIRSRKASDSPQSTPKHRFDNLKANRPCSHNGTTYPSMNAASVVTKYNRYWVNKWCNEESNGWRWI